MLLSPIAACRAASSTFLCYLPNEKVKTNVYLITHCAAQGGRGAATASAASALSSASRSAWPTECAAQIGFAFGLYIFMSAIFEQTLLSKEQRERERRREGEGET